jgi:hypothetical protein
MHVASYLFFSHFNLFNPNNGNLQTKIILTTSPTVSCIHADLNNVTLGGEHVISPDTGQLRRRHILNDSSTDLETKIDEWHADRALGGTGSD